MEAEFLNANFQEISFHIKKKKKNFRMLTLRRIGKNRPAIFWWDTLLVQ